MESAMSLLDERNSPEYLTGVLEALLFASGEPATAEQLADAMEIDPLSIKPLADRLKDTLLKRGSGLTIRAVGGGYQLVTRQEYYGIIEKLTQIKDKRLSVPTMAVLAIIAFKQPITKQEIEIIRGGGRAERALAKLLELELIEEKGRKQALGRPILYGTTDTFLHTFGLQRLEDLPSLPTFEDAAQGMDDEQLKLVDFGTLEDTIQGGEGING